MLANGWVADDAYITFRVVDNFIHGYGLRWNIDERVQVYTHPLWMLLHIPFYAAFGNIYVVTIVLSALCGLAAVWMITRITQASLWSKALLVMLPVVLSRTFSDFVICGLENPLSFLLIAWLAYEWFQPGETFRLYRFYFIVALLLLTRLDNVMIILPALAWTTWQHRRRLRIEKLLLAFSPLILWWLFCLFYYGFVFPNTKYAKLNTGIAPESYIVQGWHYIGEFFFYDFFSFALIVAAVGYGLWRSIRRRDAGSARIGLLALGCLLHILYVVYVGGDFMNGRFFANAFIVAIIILYLLWHGISYQRSFTILFCSVTATLIGTYILAPTVENPTDYTAHYGIVDERAYYYSATGLLSDQDYFLRLRPKGIRGWIVYQEGDDPARHALLFDDNPEQSWIHEPALLGLDSIGVFGYYLGPKAIIIDNLALADPLLARLPAADPYHWRIGHFTREISQGYWHARRTGDLSQMDPDLAFYYQELRRVVSGDLWDKDRLLAILGFQLGFYDSYRNRYLIRQRS